MDDFLKFWYINAEICLYNCDSTPQTEVCVQCFMGIRNNLKVPRFHQIEYNNKEISSDNSIIHTHLNLHAFSNNKSQLFLYLIKVNYI